MAKLLMKSGKYLNPAGVYEIDTGQIKMLRVVRIGECFDVMDTTAGTIEWDIAMSRTDRTGSDGDKVEQADIALFG